MKVEIEGTGLSGGYGKLEISESNRFAIYYHDSAGNSTNIPLNIQNISVHNHLVSIGKSPGVNVVEHLFSALYGLNLFDVRIDFFSNEVPFFDGSSIEFVKFLQKTRNQNSLRTLRLSGEILIKDEESFIYYMPIKKDLLTVEMEFCHPFINLQKIVIEVNKENYVKEIAPARTFVFTDETDGRLKNLPPYGIGITKYKIYSASPLRFPDEFVRHKILDLLGDLYVLQKKLSGKIVCKNTSHNLNQKFIRRILEE